MNIFSKRLELQKKSAETMIKWVEQQQKLNVGDDIKNFVDVEYINQDDYFKNKKTEREWLIALNPLWNMDNFFYRERKK